MANTHTYEIDLTLETSTQSKQAIAEFKQAVSEAEGDVESIGKAYDSIASSLEDTTALAKEYESVLNGQIKAIDKQIDAVVKELATNRELTDEQRDELKMKLKKLDAESKTRKLTIARLKQEQLNKKVSKEQLAVVQKQLTIYQKMGKALKDVSEKASKVAKASQKFIQGAGKVAKGAGIAVAAGGALIGGVVGAGIQAGQKQDEKYEAARGLKNNLDARMMDRVYIQTGEADYHKIVDAINRAANLVSSKDSIVEYASFELMNPGSLDMFKSQKNFDEHNLKKMITAVDQTRKQTGIYDLSPFMQNSMMNRSVTTGALSQAEYIQAAAALTAMGVDQEKFDRIINSIASKGGSFLDNFNRMDFGKYGKNAQHAERIRKNQVKLEVIDTTKSSLNTNTFGRSLRDVEVQKQKLMENFAPVALKLLSSFTEILKKPSVQKFFEKLPSMIERLMEFISTYLGPILDKAVDFFGFSAKAVSVVEDTFKHAAHGFQMIGDWITGDLKYENKKFPQKALGGIVDTLSIIGEQGRELVLPLNNPGRSSNIINNFYTSNSFNTTPNPTELSLSQQLGSKRFARRAAGYGGF